MPVPLAVIEKVVGSSAGSVAFVTTMWVFRVFVIVQVLLSPGESETVPSAAQAPLMTAV